MPTITLAYNNGTEFTRSFTLNSAKGFDVPDEFRIVGVQHRYLSGAISEQIQGFQRVITLDFGVINSAADREFLWNFIVTANRQLRDSSTALFYDVALEDYAGFTAEWLDGSKLGTRLVFRVIKKQVETLWDAGAGYGYDYGGTGTGYGDEL